LVPPEEVERRRRRREGQALARPARTTPGPLDEKHYDLARSLSSSARLADEDPPIAPTADEILNQHTAAAAAPPETVPAPAAPAATPAAPAAPVAEAEADEILEGLERHHQRTQPTVRQGAPRGSADLQPRIPAKSKPTRRSTPVPAPTPKEPRRAIPLALKPRRPSARVLAVAALALAVAITAAVLTGNSHTSQPTQATARPITIRASLVAPTKPTDTRRAKAKPTTPRHPVRRRSHPPHRRGVTPQHPPAASTAAVSTPPARAYTNSHSYTSPSSSYRPPSSYSPSTGSGTATEASGGGSSRGGATSGGSQPAGPTGVTSGTVGSNCNPKCS